MKKTLVFAIAALAMCALEAKVFERQSLVCGQKESFRSIVKRVEDFNCRPIEGAVVKAECNGNALKLTIDMVDNDIFSEAETDQCKLQGFGDNVTVFLKSKKDTWLWEFIVAPNGKRACYLHPGAGRMFYPELKGEPGFTVKNKITKGKWLCEITIPEKVFKAKGFSLNAKDQWTIMVVRQNFSRFLAERENSSYPQSPGSTSNPDYFADLVIK